MRKGEIVDIEAAVQSIRTVVRREVIIYAIQGELSPGDAIAIPANQRAEVWAVGPITVEIVVTQDNVPETPILVRHPEGLDNASVI